MAKRIASAAVALSAISRRLKGYSMRSRGSDFGIRRQEVARRTRTGLIPATVLAMLAAVLAVFASPQAANAVQATGDDVAAHLRDLTPVRAASIGRAARARVLAEHTYAHRAREIEALWYAPAPAQTTVVAS